MNTFLQSTSSGRGHLPLFIRLWFGLDIVLALAPPLHWAASGADLVFGVPRVLGYLFAASALIAASVVAAYLAEVRP